MSTLASGGGGSGCRGGGGRIRAGVGHASRGRRRVEHPGPKVVPSACLNHAWAREGKEIEGIGGGGSLY